MQGFRAFLEDNVVAIVVIAIVVLIAMGGIAWTLVAQAKWDTSVAEANTRALQDTVRVYQGIAQGLEGELGEKTRAATLMQEQLTINSDSIQGLNTGLGVASRALQLSQRALSRAEVPFNSAPEKAGLVDCRDGGFPGVASQSDPSAYGVDGIRTLSWRLQHIHCVSL